jgi:hypothetical protein
MYKTKTSFVYGFHGIDKEAAYKILNNEEPFLPSHNEYDWLGSGIYFWENNLSRAKQYAVLNSKRNNSKIKTPFVLAAILDLGNCFDLLEQENLDFLASAFEELESISQAENIPLPENKSFSPEDFDLKKRELDCAVIRLALQIAEQNGVIFDSVRSVFWEGRALYPNAGFKKHNHIQIAIRNPDCIKGIFLPREKQ